MVVISSGLSNSTLTVAVCPLTATVFAEKPWGSPVTEMAEGSENFSCVGRVIWVVKPK